MFDKALNVRTDPSGKRDYVVIARDTIIHLYREQLLDLHTKIEEILKNDGYIIQGRKKGDRKEE